MSTIGHPLSDLASLLSPWHNTRMGPDGAGTPLAHAGFLPGAAAGLPAPADLLAVYHAVVAARGPQPGIPRDAPARARDLRWAAAFATFRNAAIAQGIAARLAVRQASSARAAEYARLRRPLAELAWRMVGEVEGEGEGGGAKL